MRIPLLRISLCLCVAASAFAIETTDIELREGATNDGAVSITRGGGELLFRDTTTASPVSLSDLLSPSTSHAALTGLSADDHPHYLNAARHATAHTAAVNSALPIVPGIGGTTTIGGHMADSSIHLARAGGEVVSGPWAFTGSPVFSGPWTSFAPAPGASSIVLSFADTPTNAQLTYTPATNTMLFSRVFAASEMRADSFDIYDALVRGILDGSVDGVPTATITGFQSIEGIGRDDLLSRSRAESIAGAWTFTAPLSAQNTASGDSQHGDSVSIAADMTMSPGEPKADTTRRALHATLDYATGPDYPVTTAFAAAVHGAATTNAIAAGSDGVVAGVAGEAVSTGGEFHAAGVVGVASGGGGDSRAGIVGALDSAVLGNASMLPAGSHAGVFLGDVWIQSTAVVPTVAFTASNGSGATINAGEAVAWRNDGTLTKAATHTSATAAFAGVALNTAAPGTQVRAAAWGIASVKTSSAVTAGTCITWNGSGAIAAPSGCKAPLGTAITGHSGSGTTTINVMVQASFVP